jgi:Spy/CpxP family protein refolding chaperone
MIKKLSALGVCLLAAMPIRAETHHDPFEGMQNPKQLLRGASLTEAQVAKIRELRQNQWEQEKEIQTKMSALWSQFEDKFTREGPVDVAELTSIEEQFEQLQARSERAKFMVMLLMRSLLTPEQVSRVSQTHQKVKDLSAQARALEPTIAGQD